MINPKKIPTICLNMIVKNESQIIIRLLESVLPLIDSYCICDTGSTDDTIHLISTFFQKTEIQGKIIQEPFRDFGYNRTFALDSCADIENSDYILLLDADMILWMNPKIPIIEFKEKLIGDAYLVSQGTSSFHYKNVRIVRNRIGFSYWGVTHEFAKAPHDGILMSKIDENEFFISDIGDGGCKDDKIVRDIRLLTAGLETNPSNGRYTFYLANSYQDQGNNEKAIEFYKKRIEIGGWIEEIWHSHYSIGNCYKKLRQPEIAIIHWLEAYNKFPSRIENLYEIIRYYREKGNTNLAYMFFTLADYERKNAPVWDYLFTQLDVYNFKIDYELTIIGYHCNRHHYDLNMTCMKVLTDNNSDKRMNDNVLSNYKFYTASIIDHAIPIRESNLDLLKGIGKNLVGLENFTSSTPTVCFGISFCELLVGVRFVNYKIDESGRYINKDQIISKNVIAVINISKKKWYKEYESILAYNESFDDHYVGLEDVRLHRSSFTGEQLHTYNANRGIDDLIKVEHGVINFDKSDISCICSKILKKPQERSIEKNWVLFDYNENISCVYQWYPLTIGVIDKFGTFNESHNFKNVPAFFERIRGSTNGIIVDDQIWFICHLVSYDNRRYYYHIMVLLDKHTLRVISYTPLWTFEKQPVEYTLGMVLLQNRLLIGYSILDCETKYTIISTHIFKNMMIINNDKS